MRKRSLSILVFILLVIGMLPTQLALKAYGSGNDVTNLLSEKVVVVKQDGEVIPENGTLDFSKNIDIRLDFKVPVLKDFPEGTAGGYVNFDDTASFIIAEGFSLQSAGSFDLNFRDDDGSTKRVGTLTIDSEAVNRLKATVAFNGDADVFSDYTDVHCYFEASLKYIQNGSGNTDADYDITILEKTYKVHVPALPVIVGGQKTGQKTGEFIDWKVKIEAKQGDNQVDLSGYSFLDDLASVGALVGTFKISNSDDPSTAIDLDPQPTLEGSAYHTFGAGNIGPKYLFFRTAIPQDFCHQRQSNHHQYRSH